MILQEFMKFENSLNQTDIHNIQKLLKYILQAQLCNITIWY